MSDAMEAIKWDSIDTIPLFKKWTGNLSSYSQPKLYSQLFKEKYSAHIALADAIALRRLYHHLKGTPHSIRSAYDSGETRNCSRTPRQTFGASKVVKTQAMWADMGIRTVKELRKHAEVCSGSKQTHRVACHTKIYDQLYAESND